MPSSPHSMSAGPRIAFEELSTSATDFLHELNDPALLRHRNMPPRARSELRRQQVRRLKENIDILLAKRAEFNRKMEEYIENLRALIRSIEKGDARGSGTDPERAARGEGTATLVRCLGCESQRLFRNLQVIFARESQESLDLPTEVYVLDGDVLKKGRFRCESCGSSHLVIRPV